MSSINNILTRIEQSLLPISGSCSLYEAETILKHVFQCSRSELYATLSASEMPAVKLSIIDGIIQRRLADEPLAYILGSIYFYSKEIFVTKDVLIPRPETEVLVETVLNREQNRNLFFSDIGTGSGAIAGILLAQRQSWKAVATDISRVALSVARRNSPDRTHFICCDMFTSFKAKTNSFDFLVCNPPYISRQEIVGLDKSVFLFEPHSALDGGTDGMDFYRVLATEAHKFLKPGGRIYCEIGCDQGAAVREIFSSEKWKSVTIRNDLTGRPRVVMAILELQMSTSISQHS
jgi:release factor glutamine methyltransferase